jgi:hypothetical protein
MTEEQELTGVLVVFDRPSTTEEQQKFRKKRVFDSVPAEDFSKLPKDDNRMIAGLPAEVSIEPGPVGDISQLRLKIDDPYHYQMLRVVADTNNSKYTSQNNEEIIGPLLPVIYNAWPKFLSEYAFIEYKNGKSRKNGKTMWRVIYAIADGLNRRKSLHVPEAFLKLYEEGPINYHGADGHTRIGAAQLSRMGLAKYVAKSISDISFEQITSFKEFHEGIKKMIEKSIKDYRESGQSTLLFDEGYKVLLAREKGKDYFDRLYGKKDNLASSKQ